MKSAKKAVNREFELYKIIKKRAQKIGNIGYIKDIPSFGFRGSSALFASTVTNTPVGLCIHTREKYIDITIRTRDYSIDLKRVAEKAAESVNGSGGGHRAAAGAKIPLGTLEGFLGNVDKILECKN